MGILEQHQGSLGVGKGRRNPNNHQALQKGKIPRVQAITELAQPGTKRCLECDLDWPLCSGLCLKGAVANLLLIALKSSCGEKPGM